MSLILCILNSLYILVNIHIGINDIKYKIITNKSNICLFTLGLIIYVLEYLFIKNKVINVNINVITSLVKILLIKFIIMIIIFLLLILFRKIFSNNIGGGDIKMIFALMIKFNLSEMLNIIIISTFTSLIYSLYLIFIKHKTKDYKFSFGEFIALGVIITMITC